MFIRNIYYSSIIFTTLSLSLLSGQSTIAVLQFDAHGISATEVATLSDRFRDELFKSEKYIVVTRGEMEEILSEQGFQQSGCVSDECVVEAGQLLGVQQMISGSIGKVGNAYSISVHIIDVKTGEILNISTYDHFGEIELLLTVGIQNSVQRLLQEKNSKITIDGNVYQTVKIGDMLWMSENLKVTHYRNGDPITNVTDTSDWAGLSSGAFCFYDNNIYNESKYGCLYNWYAINDSRNIAPKGWHVPSDEEWKQLEIYLGIHPIDVEATGWRGKFEGGSLKVADTTLYGRISTGGAKASGFNGLFCGYRKSNGEFYALGHMAYYWTSSEHNKSNALYRSLYNVRNGIYRGDINKSFGFSIRCVKD